MRRNKRHVKVWLLTFFVSTTTVFAQNAEQRQKISSTYSKAKLSQLAKQFSQEAATGKEAALKMAAEKGWEVMRKNQDGTFDELMALTPEGSPLYYTIHNVDAAASTRTNHLNIGGSLGLNLDGQNMTVGVWDGGPIQTTHQEFDGPGGNNRVSIDDGQTTMNGNSFHMQHVTGTIVAYGADPAAKGMAPQADAITHTWTNDLAEMANAAANGLLVSNHSYGFGWRNDNNQVQLPAYYGGGYISNSRDLDQVLYNAPYYLMVNSAGNDGDDNTANSSPLEGNSLFDKLTGFSTAKNNLVVANAQDVSVDANGNIIGSVSINSSSSEGPTDDYRIKPDITGNGTSVYSTINYEYSPTYPEYANLTGTSMSSPNVAGSMILLQQHYNNLNGAFMRAATAKGLALHTADDAGISGPDAVFGWGLLNAKAAAETISENGTNSIIDERSLSNGASYSVDVTSDGSSPLIVSISWTDPAGVANTGTVNLSTPVLVNDLDLRVTKGGSTFSPYRLTGVNSNGTGDNNVDPYERVDVSGASGTYTVTVTHKGSLSGSQNFSLIVTGVGSSTPPPPPVCIASFPYSEGFESNDGWTQVGGDDGNWVRNSGTTPSSNTGPGSATEGSFYMFLEASSNSSTGQIGSNATAILESECFDLSALSAATFSFQHHMYGTDVGSLTVQGSADGTTFTNLWTLSGDQGNQWNAVDVNLSSYVGGDLTLRIVGTTGNGWSSDIAVDDLSVTTGGGADTEAPTAPTGLAASNIQETTLTLNWNASSDNVGVTGYDVYQGSSNIGTVTGTSANITQLTAATAYTFRVKAKDAAGNESGFSNTVNVTTSGGGGISCASTESLPYSEGFESNDGWTQVTGDDGNWVRNSGTTPSSNTGPSAASGGSFYLFLEASSNSSTGQIGSNATAILESDCFDLSSESSASFSFDYHMYGTDVGSLVAQASSDGTTWTNIWNLSGNQGNSWQTASVDLAAYLGGTIKLRIVGTTGNGWSSDIAVDNLAVSSGAGGVTTNVTLTIVLDNYPEETSWEILDGSSVIASGGTYGSQADGSTVVENISLVAGCYDFVISDVYGDGICCTYGTGSYSLTDGSTTLASGGSFGSSETTNFCVGGATTSYAVNSSSIGLPTNVDIYPNPVVGSYLNVVTSREEVAYTIINMNGQQIARGRLVGGKADVSSLSHGLYIINLIDSGGKSVMKKFIKE